MFAKNLKYLRLKHNIEQQELAQRLGRKSASSISEWEKGIYTPKIGILAQIAQIFNVDLDDLMNKDLSSSNQSVVSEINETITKLNDTRKNNVLSFAKSQLDEQRKIIQADFIKEHPKLYAVHAQEAHAAGIGYAYEGTGSLDTYYTDRNNLKAYDYASLVSGDSMEPQIKNGDVILIKQGYDNVDGGIYSIDYDGKSYLKKVYLQGGQFIMKSINKKYDDIIIDLPLEDTYLNIIGKVVDWFTPVER